MFLLFYTFGGRNNQCDQIGPFWNVLEVEFLTKVAQKLGNFTMSPFKHISF